MLFMLLNSSSIPARMDCLIDEIKTVIDGETTKEQLLASLEKKRQAWQEAVDAASFKMECLDNIIGNLRNSQISDSLGQTLLLISEKT